MKGVVAGRVILLAGLLGVELREGALKLSWAIGRV